VPAVPTEPLTAVPVPPEPADEKRAIREAAERAALVRLGQAEPPPAPAPELQKEDEERLELHPLEEDERARQAEDERVRAEAERRIREVEEMQREAEARLEEANVPAEGRKLDEPHVEEGALARELVETEQRLAADHQRTAEALDRATERLEQVESRAAEAEQRAARAERLAALKAEEIERADRLREMLDRIAKAERRATETERRARAAVERVSEPVPKIDSDAIFDRHATERPEPEGAPSDREPPQTPEPADDAPPEHADDAPPVDLNEATYEQLRGLGLSVTQTGRLLAHRERVGGFSSEEELDGIPGFSQSFLDELKGRIRV